MTYRFFVSISLLSVIPAFLVVEQAHAQRGRRFDPSSRDQDPRGGQPSAERNRPPRANPAEQAVAGWLNQLAAVVPASAAAFEKQNVDEFRKATDATERWLAELVRFDNTPRANEMLRACEVTLNA